MNTVVCNEGETYKLYNDYAIGVGFSIRRGTTRYHVGTRDISQKEYYCSSEGFSKEVKLCETRYRNRFETRTGCQAMVRFTIVDGMWKVTKFISDHNHELASPSEIHLLRSNRELTASKASVINSMINAGISGFKSSQRSESTNNVLNGIANKSISLTKFVLSFEDVVARWRSEEASEDYNCKKGLPSLTIRNSGILNHAAKVYTNKIFKLFQNELLNGIATNWSEIACHDNVYSFEVVGEWGNSRTRTVHFNASTMDISCTCKKFQSMGLLCSHALKIFIVKNVTKIPDNYILRRWTKDAKKRMIEYVQGESHANDEETATIFRNNLMKLSYDIIMRSQGNEATRQFCRDALRKLDIDINRELTRLQLSENDATTENQINEDERVILF
ncbi:hypothetical protein GH714_014577 [Hevea brasiliensis]|uniref:SWIM-type domain-containing protein n=1 Tax=Hevea brasiliensis TaxID=3981 RepID=A0A6A6NH42_HEVBR|nr:hypothetical protein GH714_014577 [Hevea brasiliensis]